MSFLIGSPSSFDPLIKASGDEGGQVEGASVSQLSSQDSNLKTLPGSLANMASIRGQRRSLHLYVLLGETRLSSSQASVCIPVSIPVCLSAGVLLVLPEGFLSLELLPSSSEVLLKSDDNFTVVSKRFFFFCPVRVHSGVQLSVSLLRCVLAGVRCPGSYLRTRCWTV